MNYFDNKYELNWIELIWIELNWILTMNEKPINLR
jgi:hypothetical protein